MSFMGFNEKGTRDVVLQNVINNSNYIGLFFLGVGMFYLSIRFIFPNDLFTSAMFFDALGLQQVFNQPAAVFSPGGFWEDLPDLTTEAFAFAASLAITQIFLGYRSATSKGSFTETTKCLITRDTGKIETEYMGWFLAYVLVAMFDTWTDTEYRSFFGTQSGLYLKAAVTSFFFYNLGSEWFIVVGSKLMLNYGFVLKQNLFKGTKLGGGGGQNPPRGGGGNNNQQQQSKKNRGGNNRQQQNKKQQNQSQRPPSSDLPADFMPPINRQQKSNHASVRRINN